MCGSPETPLPSSCTQSTQGGYAMSDILPKHRCEKPLRSTQQSATDAEINSWMPLRNWLSWVRKSWRCWNLLKITNERPPSAHGWPKISFVAARFAGQVTCIEETLGRRAGQTQGSLRSRVTNRVALRILGDSLDRSVRSGESGHFVFTGRVWPQQRLCTCSSRKAVGGLYLPRR